MSDIREVVIDGQRFVPEARVQELVQSILINGLETEEEILISEVRAVFASLRLMCADEQGDSVDIIISTPPIPNRDEELPPLSDREEERDAELKQAFPPIPIEGKTKTKKPTTRWLRSLWIGIIAFVAGGAIAVGTVQDGPAVVETQTVEIVTPGPASAASTQYLSWVGVEGATYEVVIFEGGQLINSLATAETTAEVELAPGSYQWLVYPVIGGIRQEATVNSLLTVT